jgi:hypothetical protein
MADKGKERWHARVTIMLDPMATQPKADVAGRNGHTIQYFQASDTSYTYVERCARE